MTRRIASGALVALEFRSLPFHDLLTKRSARLPKIAAKLDWPPNLWMGVSIEHRETLFRADHLRAVPAAVRFLSCEPLLGPLDGLDLAGIDWVIAGGESGPDHRPLDPSWITAIRDACVSAAVPFFFKQWGGRTPKARRSTRLSSLASKDRYASQTEEIGPSAS